MKHETQVNSNETLTQIKKKITAAFMYCLQWLFCTVCIVTVISMFLDLFRIKGLSKYSCV